MLGGGRIYVPVNVTPIGDDGFPMPVKHQPAPAGGKDGTP